MKKIKEIKIVNQDESTEIANMGVDAINVDTANGSNLESVLTLINADLTQKTVQIDDLENKTNALNMAPIPVASISDMTDIHKVYLNTTNNYWYYYNGSAWVQGGIYQATTEGSVTYTSLDLNLQEKINNINFQDYINRYDGMFNNSEIIPLMNYADVANGVMGKRYSKYNSDKTIASADYSATAIMPPIRVVKGLTYVATGGHWVDPWSFFTDLEGNYVGTITRETSNYDVWIAPNDGYIFPTFEALSGSSIANFGIYILATGDTTVSLAQRTHSEDIFGVPFDYWLLRNKKYSSMLTDISTISSKLIDESRVNKLENILALYEAGITPIYNHVDVNSLDVGKFWGSSLNKGSASGYNVFDPFFIKKDVTYGIYTSNGNLTGIVANDFTFLGDGKGNRYSDAVLTHPDTHRFSFDKDGYIYLTVMSPSGTSYDYSTVQIVEVGKQANVFHNQNEPWDYVILNKSYKELVAEVESEEPTKEIVNLTVGEDKDFSSITAAVNSISDSSVLKVYNILIDDGTYEERDITLPDYVNIIGASGDKEKCIIKGYLPANTPPSQISPSSTFNISKNNEFHNVTITCQNMRYPVHSESNGNQKNWTQIIDNCYIEHKGNQEAIDYQASQSSPQTVWTSYHAWGEGSSSGAYLKATNSTFKSEENAFYVHAANSISKPYVHILENCHLLGDVFVDDTTSPINGDTLLINNCDIQGRISVIGTNKYNMIISGSGIHPIYQKPERVFDEQDFPIFTDYVKRIKCTQSVTKGQFVYSDDGLLTVKKATSATPKKLIVGYVIGSHSANAIVPIMTAGSYEPTPQTWPESDTLTAGLYYKVGDDSKLTQTNDLDEAIAISATRWYWLLK